MRCRDLIFLHKFILRYSDSKPINQFLFLLFSIIPASNFVVYYAIVIIKINKKCKNLECGLIHIRIIIVFVIGLFIKLKKKKAVYVLMARIHQNLSSFSSDIVNVIAYIMIDDWSNYINGYSGYWHH